MLRPIVVSGLVALLAGFAACSSSNPGTTPPDAGTDPGSDAAVTCQKDPRVDTYVANLVKTSGDMKVTLVSSDPAPPVRGTNTWTIRVADGAGNPVTGAAINVTPFMPDHGHGTSVRAVVTPQADGTYTVAPVYLFMPGVWKITFSMPGPDGGAAPSVDFFFCVAG